MAFEKFRRFVREASEEELIERLEQYGVEVEDIDGSFYVTAQFKSHPPAREVAFQYDNLVDSVFVFGEGFIPETLGQAKQVYEKKHIIFTSSSVLWPAEEVA